jgi:hypothetical protein
MLHVRRLGASVQPSWRGQPISLRFAGDGSNENQLLEGPMAEESPESSKAVTNTSSGTVPQPPAGARCWQDEQERLWSELVPPRGQATTVQGELIRCTGKGTDEAYRNGNANWDAGYERMWRFVADTLDDHEVFSDEERRSIRAAYEQIVTHIDSPDLSGTGSTFYLLTEMAVRWCLARPELIHRDLDPELRR